MAVEIEAKMRLTDRPALETALRAANARELGEVIELNVFFDDADGRLRRGDQGLRLRQTTAVPDGEVRHVLTFKGPREAGNFKVRPEHETRVEDPDAMRAVLAGLGFKPMLAFEKRRKTWRLDGCLVEIDRLPHLGMFVEIEGPDDARVEAVRRRLGLADAPLEAAGYAAMLGAYVMEHGLEGRTLTL